MRTPPPPRLALCAGLLLACQSGGTSGAAGPDAAPPISPDAGRPDAGRPDTAPPDAEPPGFPQGCACGDDDDCAACFARIGACCSEDPTLNGRAATLAANCAEVPACKVCCAECAAATCGQLKRSGSCPVE